MKWCKTEMCSSRKCVQHRAPVELSETTERTCSNSPQRPMRHFARAILHTHHQNLLLLALRSLLNDIISTNLAANQFDPWQPAVHQISSGSREETMTQGKERNKKDPLLARGWWCMHGFVRHLDCCCSGSQRLKITPVTPAWYDWWIWGCHNHRMLCFTLHMTAHH